MYFSPQTLKPGYGPAGNRRKFAMLTKRAVFFWFRRNITWSLRFAG